MRSFILAATTLIIMAWAAPVVRADHHEKLTGDLQPLAFLLGEWGSERDGGGAGSFAAKADVEGHALRFSGAFRRDGEVVMAWTTLIFPNAESEDLEFITVGRNGVVVKGSAKATDGMLTQNGTFVNAQSESTDLEIVMKKVDDDTLSIKMGPQESTWKRAK